MQTPTTTTSGHAAAVSNGAARSRPVVIEARGLAKTFRIPEQQVDTLKERVVHPLRRVEYRCLRALREISFDVHRGEFFGIVGRNGSGKSTLLKILASIYRADRGRVRMAGRVAPFIELGVGFNPELSARENCVLNGVLMGLGRREARKRLDAVLDFGELREFSELKVKNYSSGMMVRLAFAIMVQADADIMLIDEVLAVGDAAFAQKCMDFFHQRRDAGKTIVLVSHDMTAVQSMCHRALVLHDGATEYVGDPEDAALHYYRLNFAAPDPAKPPPAAGEKPAVVDINAKLLHAGLRDAQGRPTENVEQGDPIILDVLVAARRELDRPYLRIHIVNAGGLVVFAVERQLEEHVQAGQKVHLGGRIENLLVPGRYWLELWLRRDRQAGDMAIQAMRLLQFTVYGTAPRHGVVMLPARLEPSTVPR